ncbi:hypothetical protein CHS0354_007248 [Potamilus streckersoni]|uniref:Uncharacterized protein n=1 Tax=Potamilus streckersoni TaxID=2493646 RepID=A0AAE0TD79_9BIVA|nr:hypothetical protein CHS0354_007248 [Potamilus streckersoni]
MTEDLKSYLNKLISSVEGLLAIVITDRDGVPVAKVATEQAPELALRPNFLGTFGMATDQASKLNLSQNKTITAMYKNYQVVQMNKSPLLVTLIATRSANTGLLLEMDNYLLDVLKELQQVIIAS